MKKLYYSISEISKILDEAPHILRNWEKEFPMLKPKKNRSGNRIYSEKDLNVLKEIKKLIRIEKLSQKKVKKILEENISINNIIIKPINSPDNEINTVTKKDKSNIVKKRAEKTIEEIILAKNDIKNIKEENNSNLNINSNLIIENKEKNEELKNFLVSLIEKIKKL